MVRVNGHLALLVLVSVTGARRVLAGGELLYHFQSKFLANAR